MSTCATCGADVLRYLFGICWTTARDQIPGGMDSPSRLTGAGLWLVPEFEFRVHWNPRCATERGSPNLAVRSEPSMAQFTEKGESGIRWFTSAFRHNMSIFAIKPQLTGTY
jgi:hypothetical protein